MPDSEKVVLVVNGEAFEDAGDETGPGCGYGFDHVEAELVTEVLEEDATDEVVLDDLRELLIEVPVFDELTLIEVVRDRLRERLGLEVEVLVELLLRLIDTVELTADVVDADDDDDTVLRLTALAVLVLEDREDVVVADVVVDAEALLGLLEVELELALRVVDVALVVRDDVVSEEALTLEVLEVLNVLTVLVKLEAVEVLDTEVGGLGALDVGRVSRCG